MADNQCLFCNSKLENKTIDEGMTYVFMKCPVCGVFKCKCFPKNVAKDLKNETAIYLYYHKMEDPLDRYFQFISDDDDYEKCLKADGHPRFVSKDMIKNYIPKTFSETITKIMLGFASRSMFLGDIVDFSKEEIMSAFFVRRYDKNGMKYGDEEIKLQIQHISDYLVKQGYIDISVDQSYKVQIKPEGWKRIETLQLDNQENKNVFVAMAFGNDTIPTREAIKNGIVDAGFSPELIDEIIHNRQIVPEMLRLIRESRFLIMDISKPNYGAYYEAGYALGLGKEVIITCKEEIFANKDSQEQEYTKPHFDIAQKQLLIWKDESDLSKKLSEWIKALF